MDQSRIDGHASWGRKHAKLWVKLAMHSLRSKLLFILSILGISDATVSQTLAARSFVGASLAAPETVLPLMQYAGESSALRMLVNPPILYLQSDGRIVCLLCKENPEISMRRDENKATTEQIVSLVLRKKLKWNDGQDLTRDDIKYTLLTMARALYPEGQKPILPIYRIEMDPKQSNKITLVLRHRRSDAAQLFAISLLPKHKSEIVDKLLALPKTDAQFWTLLQDPGLYYGPFQVTRASPSQINLSSGRENNWDQTPNQDLSIRFFNSIPTLAQALQHEEVDQTLNHELTWNQYQELLQFFPNLKDRYQSKFDSSHSLEVILLNMRSPILLNPSMRLALFHAINRESINSLIYEKGALTPEGLLHPDVSARIGEKYSPAYQFEKAAQLLDQAGWKLRTDGWRYSEKDQRLSLSLSCSVSRSKNSWQNQVQSDLKLLGIELKIDIVPDSDYIRQTLSHLRFKDAACMRWSLPALSTPMQLFHALAIPDAENSYSGLNFSGWEQTSVNRILESMIAEPELNHLLKYFRRLEQQFLSDIPAIPVAYIPEVTLIHKSAGDPKNESIRKTLSLLPSEGERGRTRL